MCVQNMCLLNLTSVHSLPATFSGLSLPFDSFYFPLIPPPFLSVRITLDLGRMQLPGTMPRHSDFRRSMVASDNLHSNKHPCVYEAEETYLEIPLRLQYQHESSTKWYIVIIIIVNRCPFPSLLSVS